MEHWENKCDIGTMPDSPPKPCLHMTLKELDEAGRDVRAWCFDCQRGEIVDTIIWQRFEARGWPMTIDTAAPRFRCKECRSSAAVRLYPASRPPTPPNAASLLVEGFFFKMRSMAKQRKRGW